MERKSLRGMLALLVLSVFSAPVVLATSAAEAICFSADGRAQWGSPPYVGAGILDPTGATQTAPVVTGVGETSKMKAKFENITDETGKVKIVAVDDGMPNFRVRYFVGSTNVTGAMETTGKVFKNIGPGESTKALTVEVKAKAGSEGSSRKVYLDGELKNSGCSVDRVGISVLAFA